MNEHLNDAAGEIARADDNPMWITRVDPIAPQPGPLHGLTISTCP